MQAQNMKHIRSSLGDKITLFVFYLFLTICLLLILYPLIYVVSASFSDPVAVTEGRVWLLPIKPTLLAYKAVFTHYLLMTGLANSLYYMGVGTCVNLLFTVLAAYPLSRREFRGRSILTAVFVFTMYFSGGLVPSYILISKLGLVDTRAVMIIPGALSVWNMVICRTFFQANIPDEMFEAAQLDGCSEARFLWSIVLPLSKPILAVLTLYYGVAHWNSYFSAMIYLSSQRLFPLQLVLRSILIMGNIDVSQMTEVVNVETLAQRQAYSALMKYAVIVVASIPVMLIYPFVQRYFVSGVMMGSLKG